MSDDPLEPAGRGLPLSHEDEADIRRWSEARLTWSGRQMTEILPPRKMFGLIGRLLATIDDLRKRPPTTTADERRPCPTCGIDTRFDPRASGCLCGSMAHHTAEHDVSNAGGPGIQSKYKRELDQALRAGYVSVEQAQRISPP